MEQFTMEEIRQLLYKKVARFSEAQTRNDNSAFSMGEKNMASIIDSFLKNHGTTVYYGENNMPTTTYVGRADL